MEYILWVFNFANFTFRKNYTQKTKNYNGPHLILTDSQNFILAE